MRVSEISACAKCGKTFTKKLHKRFCCYQCWYDSRLAGNLSPEQKESSRAYHRIQARKYSMRVHHDGFDYEATLAKQGGGCAICGQAPKETIREIRLCVDHDHACCPPNRSCKKCQRGLLCSPCNKGLGSFRDKETSLSSAIEYLRRFRQKETND